MKKLFYFLNFTWGIIMNIFGFIGAGVMLALGKKPFNHAGSITFRIGHYWGGVSLGIFSFVSEEAGEHTLNHEFGHAIQNAVLGPFFPFVIAIPSFIRYWRFVYNDKNDIPNKPYDSIWFEGSATELGTKIAKKW